MTKKILIISHNQFGYLIDYYQYCKHLKDNFEITFICWDYKRIKIEEPGVVVHYVSRNGNILNRNLRFIQFVLKFIKANDFKIVFISYFQGVSLIPILAKSRKGIHLDIRTGSVSLNILTRKSNNAIILLESLFFESISIISKGLRELLRVSQKARILPLGAESLHITHTSNYKLHLLYVGTFHNRQIEDTIDGLYIFLKEHPEADIHYTIIGDGWKDEKKCLQDKITKQGLEKHIDMKGYVPFNKLLYFYEISNCGVSYIPMTSYFEYQPATKTYEYLMAGMPVIATQTYENTKVINELNGFLIKDTAESFAIGVNNMYNNLMTFNEDVIKKSVENYEWSKIIKNMKEEILSQK